MTNTHKLNFFKKILIGEEFKRRNYERVNEHNQHAI